MSDTTIYYGWYSEQMHRACGAIWYHTPYGGQVLLTTICSSSEASGTNWPDMFCVGRVTNYAKQALPLKPRNAEEEQTQKFMERLRKPQKEPMR